jgi:hypothetical protein
LFEKCGFRGKMPKLVACGGRQEAFDDFKIAHANNKTNEFIGLLVDSEDPVADVEQTWAHLALRDGWKRPDGADDEQVLLLTTCMETLIVADRQALDDHYGRDLQASALPALTNLESRSRQSIQNSLIQATRNCKNAYAKGKRSFEVLATLDPATLQQHLPSFARLLRILQVKL